jgi:hypothetical protein
VLHKPPFSWIMMLTDKSVFPKWGARPPSTSSQLQRSPG